MRAKSVRDAALRLKSTTEKIEKPGRSARAATRATWIDDETDRLTDKKSSSNDGRAMLQRALELLDELRLGSKG